MIHLKVLLPHRVLLEVEALQVVGDAANGSFCLKPRHVDFVTALVPGLLAYTTSDAREEFVAVDEGILVKSERDVLVSTRQAVAGADLGQLQQKIRQEFTVTDDRETAARTAVARLEADFVRRFLTLGERRG